jgi:acyl carrier protein
MAENPYLSYRVETHRMGTGTMRSNGVSSRDGERVRVTREQVCARVSSFIHEIAKIPADRITEAASIDEDLAMQSVAFVEIQVAIEDEYDIELDPIRIVEIDRLGGIVDYIVGVITAGTAGTSGTAGETD